MGRRNRKGSSRQHDVEDDNGGGHERLSLEARYAQRRKQQSMKQHQGRQNEDKGPDQSAMTLVAETAKASRERKGHVERAASKTDTPKEPPPPTSTKNSTANETSDANTDHKTDTKIDKLRLQKQRRKELKQAKEARKQQQQQQEEQTSHKRDLDAIREERATQKKQKTAATGGSFQTLRKGVQYQDVVLGTGPVVEDRKKVRVQYTLRAKNKYGKILDSSQSFAFRLGRGEVIEGWDIGVRGMRQGGGRRYLMVPPDAGYGRKNIGAGVGGILFFDITVY